MLWISLSQPPDQVLSGAARKDKTEHFQAQEEIDELDFMHKSYADNCVFLWLINGTPGVWIVTVSHVPALLCAIWWLFTLCHWHILPGRAAATEAEPLSSCEPGEVFEIPCWVCALFCLILTLPLSAGLLLIMLSLLAASSSPSQDDRCVGAWLLSKTWRMCDRDRVIPLGVCCMWKELYLCVSTVASQPDQCDFDFFAHVEHVSLCLFGFLPKLGGSESPNCAQELA